MKSRLRIHKNIGNYKIYMLSYDISADYATPGHSVTKWEYVLSDLVQQDALCLDMDHLFSARGYGSTMYAVRPVKSVWIFFSKRTITSIDNILAAYIPQGLMYSISEVRPHAISGVAQMNLDYNLQWEFDDKLDAYLANN